MHDLTSKRIQVDEIWSFTYAKQKNVAGAKAAPIAAGDTWTWTAIDADTKLIASYAFGVRPTDHAEGVVGFLIRQPSNLSEAMAPCGFGEEEVTGQLITSRLQLLTDTGGLTVGQALSNDFGSFHER